MVRTVLHKLQTQNFKVGQEVDLFHQSEGVFPPFASVDFEDSQRKEKQVHHSQKDSLRILNRRTKQLHSLFCVNSRRGIYHFTFYRNTVWKNIRNTLTFLRSCKSIFSVKLPAITCLLSTFNLKNGNASQCGNFMIFLPLRFCVKSILWFRSPQNCRFGHFNSSEFCIFVRFSKNQNSKPS